MNKKILITSVIIVLTLISIFILIPKKQTINIGVIGNFSGGETSYDVVGYKGIELAAKEINEVQNDTNYELHKIDISVYDTDKKLDDQINKVKADIILGPFLSSGLVTVSDYIQTLDIPVIVVSATYDSVTGKDDNVFRIMNSTSIQAQQTAELLEYFDYTNVAMLYDTNNQMYSKEIVDYMVLDPAFDNISYSMTELIDTSINYNTVINEQHDAIFICSDANRTSLAVNKIREDGIDIPIYLCSWADSGYLVDMVNYNSNDVFMYTNRNILHEEAYDLFEAEFVIEFQINPSIASMYGYEVMYMLYTTNESSDGINDSFVDLINSYDPYQGLFLNYYNDDNGDFYSTMGLYEIRNHHYVKQIILTGK